MNSLLKSPQPDPCGSRTGASSSRAEMNPCGSWISTAQLPALTHGESLAINAGYREFHRSPHHLGYTRQTVSKNDLLIGGRGQLAQSAETRGEITRFQSEPRWVLTTGDATEAYNAGIEAAVTTEFIVPFDPNYAAQGYTNQSHLTATTVTPAVEQVIYAVLWPTREAKDADSLKVSLDGHGTLIIVRPDGKQDKILLDDQRAEVKGGTAQAGSNSTLVRFPK
jgi:hypothetical protein